MNTGNKLSDLTQIEMCLKTVKENDNKILNVINNLDSVFAAKAVTGEFSILTSSWAYDTTLAPYPYYADMAVQYVDSGDRVDGFLLPESYAYAKNAELYPIIETFNPTSGSSNGIVRIRTKRIPTGLIKIRYWMETPST